MALSNYNLTDLYRRSVKVSSKSEQNVTANHRFQTVRITGQMKADLMNSPKINNVGISDLTSLVLLRDVEQTISSTIMFQDVVVQSKFIVFPCRFQSVQSGLKLMKNN